MLVGHYFGHGSNLFSSQCFSQNVNDISLFDCVFTHFVILNSNGTNFTLIPNSYPLNNKSFKTGAEVEPASISNKILKTVFHEYQLGQCQNNRIIVANTAVKPAVTPGLSCPETLIK
jgi:hypothetical protein